MSCFPDENTMLKKLSDVFDVPMKESDRGAQESQPYEAKSSVAVAKMTAELPGRGQDITFLDPEQAMGEVRGVVLAFASTGGEVPLNLSLVRTKERLYVVIRNSDFMRMADDVRAVDLEGVSTAEHFLEKTGIPFMAVSSQTYGGKNGFGQLYVAKRLWSRFSPKPLSAKDLIL